VIVSSVVCIVTTITVHTVNPKGLFRFLRGDDLLQYAPTDMGLRIGKPSLSEGGMYRDTRFGSMLS
jgi:hypothetical protein